MLLIGPIHPDVVAHRRSSFRRRRRVRAGTAGYPYTGPQAGRLSMEPDAPFSCRWGQSGAEPRRLGAEGSSHQQALSCHAWHRVSVPFTPLSSPATAGGRREYKEPGLDPTKDVRRNVEAGGAEIRAL